jgi:hypothetical protein
VKPNTKGRYRATASGRTITPMDATIHTLIASHVIQDRMDEATSERSARAVETRRRWFTRKSKPTVVADLNLPVTAKLPTVTPS